jgi:hypothetical protein
MNVGRRGWKKRGKEEKRGMEIKDGRDFQKFGVGDRKI